MNLKSWFPFLHKSAKQNFNLLRNSAPYHSYSLEADVFVTKLFFQHIAHSKRRSANVEERIKRLLILSSVKEVINQGEVTETRSEKSEEYIRLERKIFGKKIAVIIIKTNYGKHLLLSCFHVN